MLRFVAIEPRKQHDVGPRCSSTGIASRPPSEQVPSGLRKSPHRLRKERAFAFYGDEDFISDRRVTREQALAALDDARWVVALLDPFPAQELPA
ncbi:MAG: hypothetical protein E6J70_09595 [Deltaproteobacteria bacterium]|nr:MAG: hypothetical protein E6J70_09595 [Deltaproteobacteria bacterium]